MPRPPRGAPGGRPRHAPTGRTAGPLSLARALSKFGVCSRAEAVRWIEAGRVQVGGRVVRGPARRVDPRHDEIRVDGRRVGDDTERVVLALHKPPGYVTTRVEPGCAYIVRFPGHSVSYPEECGRILVPVVRGASCRRC